MSEKIKKLSLELGEEDPTTGFRRFQFQELGEDSVASFLDAERTEQVGFRLSDSHWRGLASDPVVRGDLDALVEKRVKERLEIEEDPARSAFFEAGRQEGLRVGLEEGRAAVASALVRLEALAAELLADKERILRGHESQWMDAFAHLLKRLLVPRSAEVMSKMEEWCAATLGETQLKSTIEVFLSPHEVAVIRAAGWSEGDGRVVLAADPSLQEGEMRCECNGVGAFFSPKEALERLEEWFRLEGGA